MISVASTKGMFASLSNLNKMPKINIRKVKPEEVSELRTMSIATFRDTFAHDNTEEQMQEYFDTAFSQEVLSEELAEKESRYFFIEVDGIKAGFLKTNTGQAQTEQELEQSFEIQRLYICQGFQGLGLGKKLFEFALQEGRRLGCQWAWLGVWEKNYKAQAFYEKYGFEKFSEHSFPVGDKIDTDWLMRLPLI